MFIIRSLRDPVICDVRKFHASAIVGEKKKPSTDESALKGNAARSNFSRQKKEMAHLAIRVSCVVRRQSPVKSLQPCKGGAVHIVDDCL